MCVQKTLWQQYYSSTSTRILTPYTEGKWSKYFSPTAYQKTVVAIRILFKNTKVKVRSPDGDILAALLANTSAQAETLLHSLERAADGIGLHVNADKTEYSGINQRGDISILKSGHLKLVVKFTYLGSSVSSTENDINTRLAKAWTAFDRLSIICKSDLTEKITCSYFQTTVVSVQLYGCTRWTLNKCMEKEAW